MLRNIDIKATGPNNQSGHINIESNEKLLFDQKMLRSMVMLWQSFYLLELVKLVGNAALNFYGGLVDCADSQQH